MGQDTPTSSSLVRINGLEAVSSIITAYRSAIPADGKGSGDNNRLESSPLLLLSTRIPDNEIPVCRVFLPRESRCHKCC